MFLRRKPERAKLNQPHSSLWGHKQILHLVGAHCVYFLCKWNPLGEMAESGGQPPPALQVNEIMSMKMIQKLSEAIQ